MQWKYCYLRSAISKEISRREVKFAYHLKAAIACCSHAYVILESEVTAESQGSSSLLDSLGRAAERYSQRVVGAMKVGAS